MTDQANMTTTEYGTGRGVKMTDAREGDRHWLEYQDTGSVIFVGSFDECVEYMGIVNEYPA